MSKFIKSSFLGHFRRDFCKYCYVIKDWLLKIGPNWLQVRFSPFFFQSIGLDLQTLSLVRFSH
jgi:hypothetical protein